MEKQITTTEFAQAVHLAHRTVCAHIANGIINAVLYGKHYLIPISEIERFATARRSPGRPVGSGLGKKRPRTFSPLQDVPERFWKLVDKKEPESCWPWLGDTMKLNYGRFSYAGTRRLAHRVAYELTYGPIEPPSLSVCHHCDNPNCVNPNHLFLGTPADNVADCILKGRKKVNSPKGEAHYKHKLTASNIAESKQLSQEGIPQRKGANMYHVNQAQIWRIIHDKTWRCLLPQPDQSLS